jgi:hypothetical protein
MSPITCQAGTERGRGVALLIANLPRVVNGTSRRLYPLERTPVTIVYEAAWDPGPFWTGVEKRKFLAPTGVPTPNPSVRKESPMNTDCTARTGPVTLLRISYRE